MCVCVCVCVLHVLFGLPTPQSGLSTSTQHEAISLLERRPPSRVQRTPQLHPANLRKDVDSKHTLNRLTAHWKQHVTTITNKNTRFLQQHKQQHSTAQQSRERAATNSTRTQTSTSTNKHTHTHTHTHTNTNTNTNKHTQTRQPRLTTHFGPDTAVQWKYSRAARVWQFTLKFGSQSVRFRCIPTAGLRCTTCNLTVCPRHAGCHVAALFVYLL